jgi:hypothetical protein
MRNLIMNETEYGYLLRLLECEADGDAEPVQGSADMNRHIDGDVCICYDLIDRLVTETPIR